MQFMKLRRQALLLSRKVRDRAAAAAVLQYATTFDPLLEAARSDPA